MRRPRWQRFPRSLGVTLVELVIVIAIAGVIAAIVGVFLLRPIQGYDAQVRRAELVDAAESALRRIARDIRRALPNSVRIRDSLGNVNNVTCNTGGVTCAIEMLNTLDGARYREGPGVNPSGHNHAPPPYRLRFEGPDSDGFNVLGFFESLLNAGLIPYSSGTTGRLAIYNRGEPGGNAYEDAANVNVNDAVVITNPAVTQFNIGNDDQADEHQVTLDAASTKPFRFRSRSPNQRVYLVDMPITYLCDVSAPQRSIRRYASYNITAAQPTNPAAPPLNAVAPALLTNHVVGCVFTYQAGVAQRSAVVTLDMTIQDPDTNERVRLLHQVHVDNAP